MSSFRPVTAEEVDWPTFVSRPSDQLVFPEKPRRSRPLPKELLAEAIEAQIIPRLMLAYRNEQASHTSSSATSAPNVDDVVEFVRLILTHEIWAGREYIVALRNRGVGLESVFLQLLTPAARYLGELWQADSCSFAEVTIALSYMQRLLLELSSEFESEVASPRCERQAILVSMPGDQHSFGIHMVQAFFRKAGWTTHGGHQTSDELIKAVRREHIDCVGLSVSCDVAAQPLPKLISKLRAASLNRQLRVMVGGRYFLDHPTAVGSVGADATAKDGRRSVAKLSGLLATIAMR